MRFDQKASFYHENASIQKRVADWCSKWIERDCSQLTGLELGAGTGLLTKHLALRGFRDFCASDISRSMLEEGRARLPLIRWEKQDAWQIGSRKVDRIYACSLLQWAKNPDEVLSQWRRALLKDGRLLTCFFIEGTLEEFGRLDPRFSAFAWKCENEWIEIFRASNMEILRSETRSDVVSYESPRAALRHIHDIGAINENRMNPFELRRLLELSESRQSGNFDVSWRTMRVECRPSD